MTDYKTLPTTALISEWDAPGLVDTKDRDRLMNEIMTRTRTAKTEEEASALWPSALLTKREEMAGLYPDPSDPRFAARLYEKREFYEARAVAAGIADGTVDPCSSAAETVFELTPVQRIVSRFMHPLTPYMGLLLFHGVGVGKTCSAVTIAEQFLESAPNSKVIVLVPQALKENFKKTIFDPSKLVWSDNVWSSRQCTGTNYLDRLGLIDNPDLKAITYKTDESKRSRYTVTGYQAFANWIDRTLKKSVPAGLTDPALRTAAENEVLRRLFSDRLIIVDEAHNLRDIGAGERESQTAGEVAENQGGKALNPFLRRIVLNAEGLRLVFMSATPMYNSAPEIVLLLNYLLMNDTKKESSAMMVGDVFTKDGVIKPNQTRSLEKAARRYVSYMRGENPYTFPLRMKPRAAAAAPASLWPEVSATKNPVVLTDQDRAALNALPLVFTEPVVGSPVEMQLRGATSRGLTKAEAETSDAMLDLRMQMANITYPNFMYGTAGFDYHFSRKNTSGGSHKLRVFSPKGFDVDSVFAGEGLHVHAPKIHKIVESIRAARGICFAYSRYIKAGALPLAIALERVGFQRKLADGRIAPLLTGVSVPPPVCAICGAVSDGHSGHSFAPACYVLLTSEDDISPNFAGLVRQAVTWEDAVQGPLGANVKVVIGSQVASEGLDLKCIREMHILDSWYHLNRTDQIIGRGIRYCSHTALRAVESNQGIPLMSLNNCSIYLHVTRVEATESGPAFETADMYAYRIAIGKAQLVGKVQRLLKKHAWDCNLEFEAITFAGLPPRKQIDAQGNEIDDYSINDQDYTTYCDYQVCNHQCAVTLAKSGLRLDNSTFGVADARRIILAKQDIVRRLFDDDVMVPETFVQDIFSDLPWEIASDALMELIDGRRFKLTRPDGVNGFLVKKAGYLVFQPAGVTDTDIPMTLRYARGFQLLRHTMRAQMPVLGRAEEAPVLRKVAPGPGPGPAPGPAPAPAPAPAGADPASKKWNEWLAYVNSGGEGKLPAGLSSTLRIWSWILKRYASIPELRQVALRWWFDKIATYEEQRTLLELASASTEDLILMARPDIYLSTKLIAYRIFNPATMDVEYFCKSASDASFGPCASNIAALVERELGKPVSIPADTGPLVGFITPKAGKIVFKTLDTTKPKKHSSIGAECGNTSNLGEHHPRVRILQAAGRTSELAPLMLPDDDAWDEAAAKKHMIDMAPEHMKDITHQPLCLYMEFLSRILDARRVQQKRWFLGAIAAIQAGLKGKGKV